MRTVSVIALAFLISPVVAMAQQDNTSDRSMPEMQTGSQQPAEQSKEKKPNDMQGMSGMDEKQMAGMQTDEGAMSMHPETFVQDIVHHGTSGTSAEPDSTPTPMLMTKKGPWMLMFHANVFLTDLQQSSIRGGDKFFSTNW